MSGVSFLSLQISHFLFSLFFSVSDSMTDIMRAMMMNDHAFFLHFLRVKQISNEIHINKPFPFRYSPKV